MLVQLIFFKKKQKPRQIIDVQFRKDCRQWWHHHVEKDAFLSPSEIVILKDLMMVGLQLHLHITCLCSIVPLVLYPYAMCSTPRGEKHEVNRNAIASCEKTKQNKPKKTGN
jgi:hypothetical protein